MSKLIKKKRLKKSPSNRRLKHSVSRLLFSFNPACLQVAESYSFWAVYSLIHWGGRRLSYIFSSIDMCFLRGSPASAEKGKRSKIKNPKGLPRAAVSCNPATGPSPPAWPHPPTPSSPPTPTLLPTLQRELSCSGTNP